MDRAQGCTSNLGPIKLKRSKLTNLSTMPGQSDRGLAETQDDGCIVVWPACIPKPTGKSLDITKNVTQPCHADYGGIFPELPDHGHWHTSNYITTKF